MLTSPRSSSGRSGSARLIWQQRWGTWQSEDDTVCCSLDRTKLFTRLRAARLDNTVDAEIRRLTAIEVLIIDDFALRPLDATETSDFYELIVERHRKKTTIVTSNREPSEWLTMTADTLIAQSAIDRLTSTAHTLIIEGPSYRQRTRPGTVDEATDNQHPQ